jgi:DNA invertase Pin-like site-specific DNA recombinase
MPRTTAEQRESIKDIGTATVPDTGSPEDLNQAPATTVEPDQFHDQGKDVGPAVWEEYSRALPDEASSWRIGAVYVRDRDNVSGTGIAASVQLASVLDLMTTKGVYVPQQNVHADRARLGSKEVRTFHQLLQRGLDGEFAVLGVSSLDRICRNLVEATAIKRQLKSHGIELLVVGLGQSDSRDPMASTDQGLMERYDEMRSRQTSYMVGRAMEYRASQGYPQGRLPEGFIVDERDPSLPGARWGRPIHWVFNEPLASHIKEGAARYLDGAAFADLAAWSQDSDFEGRTPKGRNMTPAWWNQTLTNPKYAGLHRATVYSGYKPGRESPTRERPYDSDLIPCRLPALISPDDYRRIVTTARARRYPQKPAVDAKP